MPQQIGWSTEAKLLWQILQKLIRLTSVIWNVKPKYKVYTALLTQSGGDYTLNIQSAPLTVGVTYTINDYIPNDDFTNVGAPLNQNGVSFVATGTTPNNWDEGSELLYNTGSPVVTVLENTIGNIWFTYDSVGNYKINSDGLFTTNKTTQFINSSLGLDEGILLISNVGNTDSLINLVSTNSNPDFIDGLLNNTPIEIRVYA